jgi:hypothetical protein
MRLDSALKKSSPIYLGPKNLDTFWCTGWAWNCQIIFRCASIHGRAGFILCERQRALYGLKCVLTIFWQTWLHILMDKQNSTHCKHVPCNTLTHSTNEDLLNIERRGDPKSRTLSRTSDTTETRNLCVIKVIFNLLNLFWHTDKNFCFYAEVNLIS